ncbi:MAG: HAMP domain-containing protein [Deltaproteobacteria bacterium]|jgi:two-component system sensor histidine kinase CreC|nr:HAMP domain-containing protein [Deltaproteobacteria bacterium]
MDVHVPLLASLLLVLFAAFMLWRLLRSVRRGLSIRMQVFVAMATVSGGFAALLGLLAVQRLELRASRLLAEVSKEEAALLSSVIALSGRTPQELLHVPALHKLAEIRPGGLRIEVIDPSGKVLLESGAPIPQRPIEQALLRAPDGTVLGAVRVSRESLGFRQILREVASRAALLTLLLVLGTASAAALIGRAIASPIERLTQAASRIAQGERQAVLPPPFGREVRTLTQAVESMRRELEGRHLAEKLAADLSHELKNPVAAIRAAAEVLMDGALDEPEAARRFVSRIAEATQRLQGILNNLLMLTRLQARGVVREPVDLAELTRQSIEAHASQAARRRVRIESELPMEIIVPGDEPWLRRAVDNLIDNAIAFAESRPELTPQVTVQLRHEAERAVLEVKNQGPGISPEIRSRLFERFVTTRRDTGGSGLGLAIVAAVAEQHGGRVEVLCPGPPETSFRLTLPAND